MATEALEIPERCCLNCVFLYDPSQDGKPKPSLDRQTRDRLRVSDPIGNRTLQCYQEVWDAKAVKDEPESKLDRLLREDRGEFCLFYPYKPNVFPAAAKHLERRAADRQEAERDRALTRRAFWVAFAALMVSIFAILAQLTWDICKHIHSCP